MQYRLFYDEKKSNIPNVFQVRSEENGSHFTGLRLLDMLSKGLNAVNPDYVAMSKIKAYFADTFNMLDDAEKNLDVFLEHGVVESNNRLDSYSDSIDAIKITAYGRYICEVLAHDFSYLDLVCLDCAIHDEGVSHSLSNYGNIDRDLFLSGLKRDRVTARIEKVRVFLNYLAKEEAIERDIYGLGVSDRTIMEDVRKFYDQNERRVVRSATRNYGADPDFVAPEAFEEDDQDTAFEPV